MFFFIWWVVFLVAFSLLLLTFNAVFCYFIFVVLLSSFWIIFAHLHHYLFCFILIPCSFWYKHTSYVCRNYSIAFCTFLLTVLSPLRRFFFKSEYEKMKRVEVCYFRVLLHNAAVKHQYSYWPIYNTVTPRLFNNFTAN